MNYGKRIALISLPRKGSTTSSVCSVRSQVSSSNMNTDSESMVSFEEFEDGIKDNVKRKTRNLSEKKRRDQFNMLVSELFSMVSVNNKKMDKTTVLKSTIAFLKNHQEIAVQSQIHEIKEDWKPSFLSNDEFSQLMLEALDSFLIVFSIKGKILYVSESVTSLLGHLPNDLIHKSLYNFLHDSDQERVSNFLKDFQSTAKLSEEFSKEENQISFKCHIRCGSITPQDPQVYESVEFTGTCRPLDCLDDDGGVETDNLLYMKPGSTEDMCLCCTVRLQTTKIIREMPVQNDFASEFTSRHSLGWKFLFLDHRAPPVIGYLPFELLGTSGYDYYHPDDLEKISKCHEQLMQTGEGTSCHYRFLTKGQQWIWLKTRYYITYHQWNSKPEFIVCTNTVVSFCEVRGIVRKELGLPEEDTEMASMDDMELEKGEQSPSCSVTSGPASRLLAAAPTLTSDNPDTVMSGPTETGDSNQMPHSTQLEMPTTSKSVTSQLQTFLQQQQQQQQQMSPQPQPQPQPTATEIVSSAAPTPMMVPNTTTSTASMVPHSSLPMKVMNFPTGVLTVQQNQLNSLQQPQIFMTSAQRLLHDQLLHKSEQLQDAIRHQQEELRQITEQLSQAQQLSTPIVQGVGESPSPMMLQPMMQHVALAGSPAHQVMMISPMNLLKQQQAPQTLTPVTQHHQMAAATAATSLNPQVQQVTAQQQLQIQLQQVLQQPQLQPCLPFQIVPEAEDISYNSPEMPDC